MTPPRLSWFKVGTFILVTSLLTATFLVFNGDAATHESAQPKSCETVIWSTPAQNGFQSNPKLNPHTKTPSIVFGVKCVSVSNDLRTMTLAWDASPKKELVDSYAVYALSSLGPTGNANSLGGTLLGIVHGNTIQFKVKIVNFPSRIESNPIQMQLGKDTPEDFWVVAHNRYGWGYNDWRTDNPDGSNMSRIVNPDGSFAYKPGTGYLDPLPNVVSIPCTINKLATTLCKKFQWK